MKYPTQKQEGGDNSENYQAAGDIIFQGLTYTEVKDLAKTVAQNIFKQNSLVLANEAYNLVLERSDELLDNFFKKLDAKNPEAIESMRDPGMQYSLFNAQKEYAKTGDKNLADLLEDILVERAQNPERDLMQIVLDECISVAPKLTEDQFNALSLIFILKYTISYKNINPEALVNYATLNLLPFIGGIREENSRYQHLEFSGCGTLSIGILKIETILRENYLILFSKGFTLEEFEQIVGKDPKFKKYIIPFQNDNTKYQMKMMNKDKMREMGKKDNLTDAEINNTNDFFNKSSMNESEIKEYLISLFPSFNEIIERWNNSSIKSMTLTSVGIAIGHANIKRKTTLNYDLKEWIR